jgi:hypothetical protein
MTRNKYFEPPKRIIEMDRDKPLEVGYWMINAKMW